jgi:hydrogenase expression/formation protein HypC
MCLAIPALVTELLPDQMARINLDGVSKIISLALVEKVVPGDYVIVHVGHALARLDAAEAARTFELLAGMAAYVAAEAEEEAKSKADGLTSVVEPPA